MVAPSKFLINLVAFVFIFLNSNAATACLSVDSQQVSFSKSIPVNFKTSEPVFALVEIVASNPMGIDGHTVFIDRTGSDGKPLRLKSYESSHDVVARVIDGRKGVVTGTIMKIAAGLGSSCNDDPTLKSGARYFVTGAFDANGIFKPQNLKKLGERSGEDGDSVEVAQEMAEARYLNEKKIPKKNLPKN